MEDLRGLQTVTSSRLVKGPFSSTLGGEAHSPGGAVNLYPSSEALLSLQTTTGAEDEWALGRN